MALLPNGANRNQFRMKQENELKSLLTDQQFEASDNRELLLAQAKACANSYALATEGIAVVSDFQNNECHIYAGKFGPRRHPCWRRLLSYVIQHWVPTRTSDSTLQGSCELAYRRCRHTPFYSSRNGYCSPARKPD